ncbi:SsrA-binding protein SmpB [Verrucomicrobium sp. BvORR106]|uniref:SsrA-binding protein SmpB n=1 Tax=Verrucomicrobium sp. BvORR106 TaxID=1403819 RepID=UPI000570E225|nr:SsrA-binding protein SmpB [Verrucomicrobium sp. BvORR106]
MSDITINRKAPRDYHILERYEAGVQLKGTEIKSLRQGHITLSDAFARVERGEVFLYGCDIKPYDKASHEQHEAKRSRRLLLHKNEIFKLYGASQQKGLTIVALRAYWKNKKVKIEIAVGRGKDQRDQRHDLKEKVENREAQREMARFNDRGGKAKGKSS